MKLMIFADVHLDSPFSWLGGAAGDRRRHALRDTFTAIFELADSENVDAVLCAGDLYEDEHFGVDTLRFVQDTVNRRELPTFFAPGNHDHFHGRSLYALADWGPHVKVFSKEALEPVELSEGVTLWGAAHCRPRGTSGFLDGFRVDRGAVNLALFHGAERGGLAAQLEDDRGPKLEHAGFNAEQIPAAGLDFAFVGHYHRATAREHFCYPGNPDPLTFGEDGVRGPVIATVDEDGRVQCRTVEVARSICHDIEVDLQGCRHGSEAREKVAAQLANLGGYVRVRAVGVLDPDVELDHRSFDGLGGQLEGVVFDTSRLRRAYDLDELTADATSVQARFINDVRASGLDQEEQDAVIEIGLRALSGRTDLEVV